MRFRPVFLLLLFLIATASVAAAAPAESPNGNPKIIKFPGGETWVERSDQTDHVIVKDGNGEMQSESWCEAGTFDEFFDLFTKLKAALAKKDHAAVTKLMDYPFRVNTDKPRTFRTEAALLKAFDSVFTPPVLTKIRDAEPAAVFCRNGEGMLGDGVLWATVAGATALNP